MSEKKGLFGGLFGRRKKDARQAPEDAQAAVPHEAEAPSAAETGAPPAANAPIAAAVASMAELPSAPAAAGAAPGGDISPPGDASSEAAVAAAPPAEENKSGFFSRLKAGLFKTSSKLSDGVAGIFTKRKLDAQTLEELEDLLISADLGVAAAARITQILAKDRYDKEIAPAEVRAVLAEEIAKTLRPHAAPLKIDPARRPHVILMTGVNGAGKTTTIGKLGRKFRDEGRGVMFAAGDTFRAAAIEQLQVWGARIGAPVITRNVGADAAGLAYDALKAARAAGVDVLLIDTAGRLQNRKELMAELEKIVRVLRKLDETAPHDVLLTLDATVGQNALSQVAAFQECAGVTGLIMAKLDGTARGGVLVALAEKFDLPIHYIGVGESVDDLQPFDADAFARALTAAEIRSEAAA